MSRVIPTEPVEMPGNTLEGLNVQFGTIGFLDNMEEDLISEKKGVPEQDNNIEQGLFSFQIINR